MSLNITFNGYAYLNDESLSNANVNYQAFFYRNGTASSPDSWNDVRTVESTGYYNCNGGDLDWLSQEGTMLIGSKVIIVFWKGDTIDRNSLCSVLDEWGAFEVTLSGPDVYTNQVQVKSNLSPILTWTLPLSGYVNTSYTATNNSYDVHTWTWMGTSMNHWRTRYGQNIQLINTINNSDYYWGDLTYDINVSGTNNMSHQWTSGGTYEVELVIEDECGSTVTGTKYIDISWHDPVPGIIMSPSDPLPNEPIYFMWDGVDGDDAISYIDWTINDTGDYGTTNTTTSGIKSDIIYHSQGLGTDWCGQTSISGAFTNPGSHTVSVVYHWYDGFEWHHDNYSEVFTQNKFTGPILNFNQVPSQVVVGSGVSFVNTSTNVSRVGLGLPDCEEYDWTYTEDGTSTDYLNKEYSYSLDEIPLVDNASVQLCAWWSDGWDTQYTCVDKDVVFSTSITVELSECYYDLYIIGTSSDGSVTGYSWTIASGISESGPWSVVWNSPIGLYQREKSVFFTESGWYNITGYVYGNGSTTYDNEVIYIDEICITTSGITCSGITDIIWNGTGSLDLGGDWEYSGYGIERSYAKRSGTKGLDATDMSDNDQILFYNSYGTDITDRDVLIMWINLLSWSPNNSDVIIEFQTLEGGGWNTSLSISNYMDIELFNAWQRVVIPLYQFNLGSSIVHKLRLTSIGNLGFYLDDVAFGVGVVLDMGSYSMSIDSVGEIYQSGISEDLSMETTLISPTPSTNVDNIDLRPSVIGRSSTPSLRPVPGPTNL